MEEPVATFQIDYIDLASEIVSAYVSNNSLPVAELPALLGNVHAALSGLATASAGNAGADAAPKATPAQVRKSITHDALISFEDGKPYKTLRRHLTIRDLTPEAYRAKWGLPVDYPMVAAAYSEQRSSLAKSLGLGQQRRKPADAAPETAPAAEEAPKAAASPKAASAKTASSKRAPKPAAASAAEKPSKAPRRAKATDAAPEAAAEAAPKTRGKRKVAA